MSKKHFQHEYPVVSSEKEQVILVGVQFPNQSLTDVEASMEELERLVDTLGGSVIARMVVRRKKPSPAYFVGSGKVDEIATKVELSRCKLVVFDNELSGTQQKNLENRLDLRVMDRTGIILDIFSRHARTKEAKNQVELASLEYLASRLTRRWTHLERQRGGIGLRGLGERQIELDRRMIRNRISRLKLELEHTAQDRAMQRRQRHRFLRVAIVGYTNAGKSTILNHLTASGVYVDDRLFATLDPTVRIIDPKTRPPILLSDTVGFIDKLPHGLVASFRSTFAEVVEADLLLHVVDMSAPNYQHQVEVSNAVLKEMGVCDKPTLLVFNKADLVKEYFLPRILERAYVDSLVVAALREEDMARLRGAIFAYFERDMIEVELIVPYKETWFQSQIHECAKVLEKEYLDEGTKFKLRMTRSTLSWVKLVEKAKLIS